MTYAVKTKKLSIAFGEFCALDNVSLELPTGKIVGFIGPSGAGKTTLIRSIVGRQKITEGEVEVLGLSAGSAKLRPRMSYLTQSNSIYPDLTVQQCLHYFATMFGVPRKVIASEVRELIDTVDLNPQANQLISKLSGGQKQRVSLAVALIGKPELMVMDEPTVGLDPVLRDQIWQLFRTLAAQGTSLIISSHVMDEAERCDDLVLIRSGKILAHASPAELRKQTGTSTVEESFLKLIGEAS